MNKIQFPLKSEHAEQGLTDSLLSERASKIDQLRSLAKGLGYPAYEIDQLINSLRTVQCKNCDKIVITSHHLTKYCSPTCRHTSQKRIYRARLKENGLVAAPAAA